MKKISVPERFSLALEKVAPPMYLFKSAKITSTAFALVFISLSLITWQQTSRGEGKVVAFSPSDRPQSVDSPIDGRLGRWYVQEGSIVQEGQMLVELSDNDPEILDRLKSERSQTRLRVEASSLSLRTAKLNVDRQKILFDKGLSSELQLERARIEAAKFASDQAGARAEMARIEVRLSRQETQSVRAPRAGTVLRRHTGEGSQLVKAGDMIATIVPDTESRAVELFVDGNDVPLIEAGRLVRIQFEGWPAVQFSGWPSVAVGTFGGIVKVVDSADYGNGKFRVLVSPDPTEPAWPEGKYLRQGMRAHGWVILSRVRLGYELWRLFNGFPPNLAMEERK